MREKEYIQENKTIVYIRKRIYIDNHLSDSIYRKKTVCSGKNVYMQNYIYGKMFVR